MTLYEVIFLFFKTKEFLVKLFEIMVKFRITAILSEIISLIDTAVSENKTKQK